MPQPDEVTERDLKAVEVKSDDETGVSESYTINEDVGYDILEQDYEDELTATQALNLEIERAAAELNSKTEEVEADVTAEMPLATVTEIDATAELRAAKDGETDPSDTAALTINMSADDKTAELSVANDDETAEMEISGGKVG
jgi:hypothetical protein